MTNSFEAVGDFLAMKRRTLRVLDTTCMMIRLIHSSSIITEMLAQRVIEALPGRFLKEVELL